MKKNVKNFKRFISWMLLLAMVLSSVSFAELSEKEKEKKRRKLQEKIEKLRRERAKDRQSLDKKIQKVEQKNVRNRAESMKLYQNILKNCGEGKTKDPRCAEALYRMADLKQKDAKDRFLKAQDFYQKALDRWEKRKVGAAPVPPIPQYKEAVKYYKRVIEEYPEYKMRDFALFQLGNILVLEGNQDEAHKYFTEITEKYKTSRILEDARLRVGDYLYMRNRPDEAIEHFKKITAKVGMVNFAMAQFRIASCFYAMSMYDDAIKQYYDYIDKCDRKVYSRTDFRDEALEYMAASFAELPDPIKSADKFFKVKGGKPYEDLVYFTIGKKCRENDKNDEAAQALKFLLENYPNYKEAPTAQRLIVECYVIMRDFVSANLQREKLVDDFGPNSKWAEANKGDPVWMEKAVKETEKALILIAYFYHEKAQREKNSEFYRKAAQRYEQYLKMFPQKKWIVYEFTYNLAECYNALGEYTKAAENYDFVAKAPVATYGERRGPITDDTSKTAKPLAFKQEDAGYNAVLALQTAYESEKKTRGLSNKNAYGIPQARKFESYTKEFAEQFPQAEAAPEMLFLGANIAYDAERYSEAIPTYVQIAKQYPQYGRLDKVLRMTAQCYVFTNKYGEAIQIYKQLLLKVKQNDPEYMKLRNSIASAIYKTAEQLKKTGQKNEAIEKFQIIYKEYAETKIADIALFDIAAVYDKDKERVKAAETYSLISEKFPESKHALPGLYRASELYLEIPDYNKAALCYETIYKRFPKEKEMDKIIYNAGLTYEKGGNNKEAIRVYRMLERNFPKSEYAAEALYSVAINYEQVKDTAGAISIYKEYVKKYTDDKYKLMNSLVKIAEDYYNRKKNKEAAVIFEQIISTYEKYHKTADIDAASVAKAQFLLADMGYNEYASVKLKGNKKQIKNLLKKKQTLLKDLTQAYAAAIKYGIEEWTLRATYRIAECFVELANTIKDQTVSGSSAQKIAARIQILQTMPTFYEQAENYFLKNIEFGIEQNLKSKWVKESQNRFLEMQFRKGWIFEDAAQLLLNAPVPGGLSAEEKEMYKEELEERAYMSREQSLPFYENGIKAAVELYITNVPYLDTLRTYIRKINPTSEVLALKPKPKPVAPVDSAAVATSTGDPEYDKALKRIQSIVEMKISTDDKIKQLQRIEISAKRKMNRESIRIEQLKNQLKSK